MDAHPSEMSEILAGPKQFVIPVFQRFYSWEEPKWKTLWHDILGITEDRDERSTHFIGPFIVISKTRPHTTSRFLVIDGQQRLITITVMLCALRDRAAILGLKSLATAIEANSIVFYDPKGKRQTKIIPRPRDQQTLIQIIDGNAGTAPNGQSLLLSAYKFFAKQMENIGEPQIAMWGPKAEDVLQGLYHAITQRLRLVMITLDDYDNPANVYESLNFKGAPLSDADLIRNFVFMDVAPENQDLFDNNTWKPFENQFEIQGKLNTDSLTDFYYRYLIGKEGYFPRNRLYVKFMDYAKAQFSQDRREQLVDDLKRFARFYIMIANAEAKEPELRQAFERFRMLDLDTALPLILSIYDRYEGGVGKMISLSDFVSMMQALESFVIRRSLLRLRTRGYGLDFAQAIQHIQSFDGLSRFLLNKGWPTDGKIRAALSEFPIYHHEPRKTLLILLEIERSFGHRERVAPDTLSIEHVMPQNLGLAWRKALGSEAEELHDKYVHTIGNLTLTAYNQTLGDRSFEIKKGIFAESKIGLNAYFARCKEWGASEILARGSYLTEQFVKIWPRPLGAEDIEDNLDQPYQLPFVWDEGV